MRATLELLAAVFIFMNSAEDGDYFSLRGKRNGAGNLSFSALSGFDNFLGRLVDELMVIGL